MLSRVAERLYWAARYLERAENTARLIRVYDNLLFDLPKHMLDISWFNLIDLNSANAAFKKRYKVQSERNVVKFLLIDDKHYGSVLMSLKSVRENLRTTRDVIPAEAWELINELYHFCKNYGKDGLLRAHRHELLTHIIERCQGINGLMVGTLIRDEAWQFLKLGCQVERADMTTRILDAGAALLTDAKASETKIAQLVWGHVLRSQSAYMSYRRTVKAAVKGCDVAEFLLYDEKFPRSVAFSRRRIEEAAINLSQVSGRKHRMKAELPVYEITEDAELGADFRAYLNDLQLAVAEVHNVICQNWFALD